MGIFQGDVIIKAMVDLGLDEMRKNPWLLEHVFEGLKAIPYISDKYGQSNIDAAKEWFMNNKINVYMRPRNDKDELPCVSIFPGPSPEKDHMKLLDDDSTGRVILYPQEINKPINYIVKPFVPLGYTPETGEVSIDPNTPGLNTVVPGQILVNPANGQGYVIEDVIPGGVMIQPDLQITATQFGIVPEYQKYEAVIKHTFMQDTYTVGCTAHGDPQTLIWLHSIVLYTILRYREVLLEGNGFAESSVSSGEMGEDPQYEGPNGEAAFVRFITLTGQVENSWISAPKRFLESIVVGPIEIEANLNTPDIIDQSDEIWVTVADDETE